MKWEERVLTFLQNMLPAITWLSYFENEVGGESLDLSTKYAPCDNLVVLDYIPLQSDHPSNSKRGNLDIFL